MAATSNSNAPAGNNENEFRELTFEEVNNLYDYGGPDYQFTMDPERQKAANSLAGNFKIWFNGAVKQGTYEVFVYYVIVRRADGEVVDRVKCRYEARVKGLTPMTSAREILSGLLLGVAEEVPGLKWVVLIWSIVEVLLGLRGQARSPASFKNPAWTSVLLRGLFPAIVGLVGSAYAQSWCLFFVSALPFYRGNIQTTHIMEPRQFAADITVQLVLSMFLIYFIAKLAFLVSPDPVSIESPLQLPVANDMSDWTSFNLSTGKGWLVIGVSSIIFGLGHVFLSVTGDRNLLIYKGSFSHEHSRSFYGWRVKKWLMLARATLTPGFGMVENIFLLLSCLSIVLVVIFVEVDVVTLFLTFFAYEMDLGFMVENDQAVMAVFNVQEDPNRPIKDCFEAIGEDLPTYLSKPRLLLKFPTYPAQLKDCPRLLRDGRLGLVLTEAGTVLTEFEENYPF